MGEGIVGRMSCNIGQLVINILSVMPADIVMRDVKKNNLAVKGINILFPKFLSYSVEKVDKVG